MRHTVLAVLLALVTWFSGWPALAQTPETFPGVPAPVPAPAPPPPPPAARPSLTPLPPPPTSGSVIRALPRVDPQSIPPNENFSERVQRCVHYGTASGVPAGKIGRFTAECAN
jgi:hypothetical protein